jgi:hypothetical protein
MHGREEPNQSLLYDDVCALWLHYVDEHVGRTHGVKCQAWLRRNFISYILLPNRIEQGSWG